MVIVLTANKLFNAFHSKSVSTFLSSAQDIKDICIQNICSVICNLYLLAYTKN